MKFGVLVFAWLLVSGCNTGALRPLKGGAAKIEPVGNLAADVNLTLEPPDNPSTPSSQTTRDVREEKYVFAQPTERVTETKLADGSVTKVTEVIPAGTVKVVSSTRDTNQQIGAAQKDTSREISAKLASFQPVQYVGIALLLVAAAMFHPAVRVAISGGKEVQMATAAIGLTLIFGPTLFVGNERIILFAGIGSLFVIYALSRLSYYKGRADKK
jgi:hypothetical protein